MEQGLKAKAQSHDGKAEGDDGFQDPGRNTGKGIAAIFHLTNDKQVGMPGDDAGDGPCKGQGQGMADYLKFRGQQAGQYIDTNMFVDACGSMAPSSPIHNTMTRNMGSSQIMPVSKKLRSMIWPVARTIIATSINTITASSRPYKRRKMSH